MNDQQKEMLAKIDNDNDREVMRKLIERLKEKGSLPSSDKEPF